MVQLTLILADVRSAANVGSILRTADSAGVQLVICCGITPYPWLAGDSRDPVVINRNHAAIAKCALGAEVSVRVEHIDDPLMAIAECRRQGMTVFGLEQSPRAENALRFSPASPAALVVGSETKGLPQGVMAACDRLIEIPQFGTKESLNVAVATGIATYRWRS